MPRRPPGLVYGENDRPPLPVLAALGLQHIFLMSSSLVLPVVLVGEIGGSFDQVRGVVALTMVACGIGTMAQALRLPGFGSGFLCPNLCGPNFFAACMSAAWLGGLPLMRGMTIAAALVEAVFSRTIRQLGFLFPPAVTLLTMIAANVWGRGKLRLYGVLIGMVTGYVCSLATGFFGPADLARLDRSPWVAVPWIDGMTDLAFRWSLLPVFVIVSITGALKSMGNLIMCEKVNDADWKAPNLERIGNGLLADSAALTVSGLIGGMASDTSASTDTTATRRNGARRRASRL